MRLLLWSATMKRIVSIGLIFSLFGIFDVALASSTQFTFGSTTIFDTSAANEARVARLDATHVIAVTNNGATIGTVSGNDISFGPVFSFDADADYIHVTALDSTHAVIAYVDSNSVAKSLVATISGNNITYGSSVTLTSAAQRHFETITITALDSTTIVIAYIEENIMDFPSYVVAATVSGDTITLGSPVEFSANASYPNLATLDSTHFVLSYDGSGQSIRAGSVSGTTITLGSRQTPGFACVDSYVAAVDTTHALMVYCDANDSNKPKVVMATVTGTSVSLGTPQVVHNTVGEYFSLVKIDSTHLAVGYQDINNGHYAYVSLITINGSTLTIETESIAIEASVDFVSMALVGTQSIVVVSPNSNDGAKGYAVVGTIDLSVSSSSSSSTSSDGGGGNATWLLQLRKQNGLDAQGNPVSSSSSPLSSSSSTSSASSASATHQAAMSSSASFSSFSSSSALASFESPLQIRTCERVTRWFRGNEFVLGRLNARLMKHFGFECT